MQKDEEEGVCEEELSLDTTLDFPKELTERPVLGKYLIISPRTANWLVLSDKAEYTAFCFLKRGKSIREVIGIYPELTEEKVTSVVTQIVAKEFHIPLAIKDKRSIETATIHITDGCNLRCKTCYKGAEKARADEMSTNDWIIFLRQFAELGGKIVTVSGGEPLERADCLEILETAKQLGLQVVLLTNGTLINEENARRIVKSCAEVQISIDGPNRETNDSIRGEGSYKLAIEALKLVCCSTCHISIAMTPTPKTLPAFDAHIKSFAKWVAHSFGPDVCIRITKWLLKGRSANCTQCNQKDFGQQVVDMCNLRLEPGWFDKLDAAMIVPNHKVHSCGFFQSLSIGSNGDVHKCEFCKESIGNVKSQVLSSIVERLATLFSSTRVETLYPCSVCDLRYFCGGSCRLENKRANDTMQISVCDEARRTAWYERLVRINPFIFEQVND